MRRGVVQTLILICVTITFLLCISRYNHPNLTCQEKCVTRFSSDSEGCESVDDDQKIVSFSVWGQLRRIYRRGVTENAELVRRVFPGWRMRLHVIRDMEQSMVEAVCQLKCEQDDMIDLCLVTDDLAGLGDIWRFLPVLDTRVSVIISRDLDSRVSIREAEAVRDWLENTELTLHVMRDHPQHAADILAGLWGARINNVTTILRHQMRQLFTAARTSFSGDQWFKGLDQYLLSQWIVPLMKNHTCVHDSYHCHHYQWPHWRPFPTKRLVTQTISLTDDNL